MAGEVKETLYASLEIGAFGVMTIAVAMGLLVYDGFQVAAVLGRWWWRWWCRRRQETVGKRRGVFQEEAGPTCNYGSRRWWGAKLDAQNNILDHTGSI